MNRESARPERFATGREPSTLTSSRPEHDDHGVDNHPVCARSAQLVSRFVRVWLPVSLLVWGAGALGESDYEVQSDLEQVRARLEAAARELARAYDEHDVHTKALARNELLAAGINEVVASLR